jgi:hypothetical protein
MRVRLTLPCFGEIEARALRYSGREIIFDLTPSPELRSRLLVFLFSRPMHHVAGHATMSGALRGLLRRAFVTG